MIQNKIENAKLRQYLKNRKHFPCVFSALQKQEIAIKIEISLTLTEIFIKRVFCPRKWIIYVLGMGKKQDTYAYINYKNIFSQSACYIIFPCYSI